MGGEILEGGSSLAPMKTWMLPWLVPVGLLATVVLLTVAGPYAGLVVVGIGVLLVPVLWLVHFSSLGDDADTQYWRFGRR
jgi:fatty acid desaturase